MPQSPSAKRLEGLLAGSGGVVPAPDASGQMASINRDLDAQRQISARALAQVEALNQQINALRRQLAALEDALNASESRDRESQAKIADLGQRLNVALAQRFRNSRAIVRNFWSLTANLIKSF